MFPAMLTIPQKETYLFRAACSELRTEIQNTRKSSSEKMRTERAHLQHECDILNQKLTQDSLTLKDDLKGMFNDRKMAVRMEQRAMESAIQELNYKITVALNSDSRGYVEGLRWVLTRRAAMAIAAMACEFPFQIITGCAIDRFFSSHIRFSPVLILHDSSSERRAQEDSCFDDNIGKQQRRELYHTVSEYCYPDGRDWRTYGEYGLGLEPQLCLSRIARYPQYDFV